jgi:hypothetical protein
LLQPGEHELEGFPARDERGDVVPVSVDLLGGCERVEQGEGERQALRNPLGVELIVRLGEGGVLLGEQER